MFCGLEKTVTVLIRSCFPFFLMQLYLPAFLDSKRKTAEPVKNSMLPGHVFVYAGAVFFGILFTALFFTLGEEFFGHFRSIRNGQVAFFRKK